MKFKRTHCVVFGQHNEYNQPLWHQSIVWHLFRDKHTSKSHETEVFPYSRDLAEPLQSVTHRIWNMSSPQKEVRQKNACNIIAY